jgi:hypothetical protein
MLDQHVNGCCVAIAPADGLGQVGRGAVNGKPSVTPAGLTPRAASSSYSPRCFIPKRSWSTKPYRRTAMPPIVKGSIKPDVIVAQEQVTVQTSALVDDFAAMSYAIYIESTSIYFGRENGANLHVSFTDQSLLNLARLVNQAVCAMLQARGVPVPAYIGQEQAHT